MTTKEILCRAKKLKGVLAACDTKKKNEALLMMADKIEESAADILAANAEDVAAARGVVSDVMIDRLSLDEKRIAGMADGVRAVAALPDPCGVELASVTRPNGLVIRKISVPVGVVAIIYESRPNVTSDAAALAIKSGNVCVLRGGKEAWRSAHAITEAMRDGLEAAGLPRELVSLVEDTTRASATELMEAVGYVDMLIPRGGAGLIRACVENAKVPCIQTGTGVCHIFVDESADFDMALNILENAKASRPSVCNAAEVCLVHESIAADFLPKFKERMTSDRARRGLREVELKLSERAAKYIDGTPASDGDFDREFLDYVMAVDVVPSVDAAIEHIAEHSTGHSDAIVTSSDENAKKFVAGVDSAAVYVNASTRFTDGGEFGLGCEMGISTQKLHARGPMGLRELTSYKYVVTGNGQIR